MTWFAAGAAAVSFGTQVYSANSAASQGAKLAGQQSKAEGEAITAERLNYTIRNSYNTALGQMQLALKKKQAAQMGGDISAAKLMAKSDVTLANAATGTIGASAAAVASDIDMKAQSALDQNTDTFENAVENYNNDLNLMVLNTAQTTPNVRQVQYNGPSSGEIIGGAALNSFAGFASSYATRKMQLGLGKPNAPARASSNVSSALNYQPVLPYKPGLGSLF